MKRENYLHNLLQSIAAFATLFVFLTGLSSLPEIFGQPGRKLGGPSGGPFELSFGVLNAFNTETRVAIAMLSLPLFCMMITWFLATVSNAFFSFLNYLEINVVISDSLFRGLILLPVSLGFSMFLMIILFGTYLDWIPALLGLACPVVTALLLWRPDFVLQLISSQTGITGNSGGSRRKQGRS